MVASDRKTFFCWPLPIGNAGFEQVNKYSVVWRSVLGGRGGLVGGEMNVFQ